MVHKIIDFPFNVTSWQLNEAKDKLMGLTHSLKSVQVCGKGKFELSERCVTLKSTCAQITTLFFLS
jgi:hypothetical protein